VKIDSSNQVKEILIDSIKRNSEQNNFQIEEIPEIILLATKNKSHGDIATNIALQLSRIVKLSPMDIAHFIVGSIDAKNDVIEKMEIAKPGFINFWFKIIGYIKQ